MHRLEPGRVAALGLAGWMLLGCATSGAADEVGAGEDPARIVEAFLAGLSGDDISAAFDAMMDHSIVDEAKPLEIQAVKGQLLQTTTLYGKALDFELVSRQPFGSSLMRYVYLSRHKDVPLVWEFWLYRGDGPWQVLNFHFNDQLRGLR